MARWRVRSSVILVVCALALAACSDPTRSTEYRDLQDRYAAAEAEVVDLEARLADARSAVDTAQGAADAAEQDVADLERRLTLAQESARSAEAQLANRIALDRYWPSALITGFTDMCVRRAPDTLTPDQQRVACGCTLSLWAGNLTASDFALAMAELATATEFDPITGAPAGVDPEPFGPLFGAVDTCNTPWLLPAGG